jgi:hypothetical protein
MPRSRSYWLSRFLQYGQWHCGHDELRHCRSMDDIRSWLSLPCTGTVETAAAAFWRLLPPGVQVVTVRRPVDEVMASLRRSGMPFEDATMRPVLTHLDAKLVQIAHRLPDVVATTFEELGTEAACARVFERCLPYRHDPAWWQQMAAINLQVNLVQLVKYFAAHWPQVQKLRKQARHRCLAAMRIPSSDIDGVTFQVEDSRTFFRDAQQLFAEHLAVTDQSPDDFKNVPLFMSLDDIGALQIMTARSGNGLMLGYLVTVIAPSLDTPGVLHGWHNIFFASSEVRGLGMKLQRAALVALRERGVSEVQMRAGHRGAGPRLGTIYRRLGAEEFGQLYRLPLEA